MENTKTYLNIRALILLVACILNATSMGVKAESAYNPEIGVDWVGAQWLKATDTPTEPGQLCTIVDVDLTIENGKPAVIFGWTADRAYFQWQLIADANSDVVLRRCVRTFTDNPPYDDVTLPEFSKEDILGKQIHMRIEASGSLVSTYLNGQKIDTYKCNRQVLLGKAGIRVESGDEALVDNFDLTLSHPNGNDRKIVSENFSGNLSLYFLDAQPEDGKWRIVGADAEKKYLSVDESYPTFYRYFQTEKTISSATLYASALGIYDVWINGCRVGSPDGDGSFVYDELKPGWTDYNKRVSYSVYDVTSLFKEGENVISSIVTPGWLMGKISRNQYKYPIEMAFLAKLEIVYSDGTKEDIVTDDKWCTEKYSHILKSDIYNGEIVDGRRSLPGADKSAIMPCKPLIYNYTGMVEEYEGPNVRVIKDLILSPLSAVVYADVNPTSDYGEINVLYRTDGKSPICLKAGETAVVDFGQNCAGIPYFKVKGDKGVRLHFRFGEVLNDTGEKSRGNDGPGGSLYTTNLRAAKAELYYVLRGDAEGETYRPTSTFFGYRYCEITASDDIEVTSVDTWPLSSSHDVAGSVITDNQDVNRLFSNILWSQLSNFISVPTDCPQRDERLGWTADAQVFATTAMYNANVGDFYRKWLKDMRDSQREDGAYSDVSPLSLVKYGSAGWSDAGIVVPWQVYMMTGDKSAIIEHYESMEKYMTWLSTLKENGIKYPGAYTTYGDLFAPHAPEKRFVSQAYYYYDALLMSKMSKVLSDNPNDSYDQKATEYRALSEAIRQEIQERYFDYNGLKNSNQSGCVISLWFGLCADEQQQRLVAQKLYDLLTRNGYRLDTGFISTPYVLQVLCDYGYTDAAYELLTQHDYPSWLYMVDNGATTMWENWYCYRPEKGFCEIERNSFNHFALGSFGSWMYSHMAGILACEDKPGFERVVFSPNVDIRESISPNRKITHAKAIKQIDKGSIIAEWRLSDNNVLTYDISIPEGIEAEVRMPVSSSDVEVYESSNPITPSERIQPMGYNNGRKIYSVQPGEYHFSTSNSLSYNQPLVSDNLIIWPNPVTTVLNITSDSTIKEVSVMSLSGDIVIQQHSGASVVDVSSLPNGFYIANISTSDGPRIKKFIKN